MGSVLMTGDLHGNTDHAVRLVGIAVRQECERMFVLGDFGAWEHTPDGRRYFDVVNRVARKRRVHVYFLDGNHDKTSLIHELYDEKADDDGFLVCRSNIRYAPRGHRWVWGETRFAAFGGAYSVDKPWRLAKEAQVERNAARRRRFGSSRHPVTAGKLWFPEEQMPDEEFDAALAADPTPVDVLLAHDKPRDSTPDWNRKNLPECLPNQDRVQRAVNTLRPGLMLHGHLHYRYTDTIRCGADRWTRVEGLGADPEASHPRDYAPDQSWLVLRLPYRRTLADREQPALVS
ncbi:metallophosphoesterase [Nocardia sp. NPDC051463]|uniref:metallophosphoesterase family protein n=1 Tax=Nocardia sp. NPDC051463 TaxID=3154845 RepID=UPI00344C0E0B